MDEIMDKACDTIKNLGSLQSIVSRVGKDATNTCDDAVASSRPSSHYRRLKPKSSRGAISVGSRHVSADDQTAHGSKTRDALIPQLTLCNRTILFLKASQTAWIRLGSSNPSVAVNSLVPAGGQSTMGGWHGLSLVDRTAPNELESSTAVVTWLDNKCKL